MNAQDDESLDGTPPPPPKPTFDRAKVRSLLNTAARYGRNPGGDFVAMLAEQLQLAVAEIDGAQSKIDHEQASNLRAQRERDDAMAECRILRRDLLAARAKIPAPKDEALMNKVFYAEKPKKRGPKAKVVPIAGEQQKAAQ